MWILESCFRLMKTTGLAGGAVGTPQPHREVRPMVHWIPHRITAHLGRCVLVLMLQCPAETITAMTRGQPRNRLAPLDAVRSTTEGRTIVQASKIGPEARAALE